MSKAPSMPMFWDAYLADTTHLTTEEHGAYLLLLGAMWRRNGWVPDDDKDNARILGMTTAKWRRMKSRLSEFLTFEGGHITQQNLLKIWENTQEKIEKNRANGALGGRPKSNKNKDIEKANGSISDNPNETIPKPEPDIREETYVSSLSPDGDECGPAHVDEISEAVAAYNAAATESGWPAIRILSKARRSALSQRLRECDGIDGWRDALRRAQDSPHCCGQNERGWTANFDFLTRQSSFAKLMEGNYDARPREQRNTSGSGGRMARIIAAAAAGTSGTGWG